jgi:hypothetical protein
MSKLTEDPITANGVYEFDATFNLGTVMITGDLGGGEISIEISEDNIEWVTAPDSEVTEPSVYNIMQAFRFGRVRLKDATAPNVKVFIKQLF